MILHFKFKTTFLLTCFLFLGMYPVLANFPPPPPSISDFNLYNRKESEGGGIGS